MGLYDSLFEPLDRLEVQLVAQARRAPGRVSGLEGRVAAGGPIRSGTVGADRP